MEINFSKSRVIFPTRKKKIVFFTRKLFVIVLYYERTVLNA
jgi:hypothetical protein